MSNVESVGKNKHGLIFFNKIEKAALIFMLEGKTESDRFWMPEFDGEQAKERWNKEVKIYFNNKEVDYLPFLFELSEVFILKKQIEQMIIAMKKNCKSCDGMLHPGRCYSCDFYKWVK